MQYSCGYFTDPGNSLEQAQLDKKTHLAAKMNLKPAAGARHRLRLGRAGAVSEPGRRRRRARRHPVDRAARGRARAGAAAGVSDRVKFELIDYRDVDGRSTASCRSACSSMSARLSIAPSSTNAATCSPTTASWSSHDGPDGRSRHHRSVHPEVHLAGRLPPLLVGDRAASEPARLIMADCEALRLHYPSIRSPLVRAAEGAAGRGRPDATTRVYRLWLFYLAASPDDVQRRGMGVYQIQYLRRPRRRADRPRLYVRGRATRARRGRLTRSFVPMLIARFPRTRRFKMWLLDKMLAAGPDGRAQRHRP